MKLLRLALRNYRGIAATEVRFAPQGVTIVVGPNEVGKSSLEEALHLALTELDSANTKTTRAIRPVHLDAGPEVELEAECGPYHFVLMKRFVRDKATTLRVLRPGPEQHTGREAHQRLQRILDETVDREFWSAVSIRQGDALAAPALGSPRALTQALDRAAGTMKSGDREESLFARIEAEYHRYFTAGGKEGTELTRAAKAVAEIEPRVAEIAAELAALEADIERLVVVAAEERSLEAKACSLAERATALEADLAATKEREAAVATLEARHHEVRSRRDATERRVRERRAQVEAVHAAARRATEEAESLERERPLLDQATQAGTEAEAALRAAVTARDHLEAELDSRRAEVTRWERRVEVARLAERRDRARAAIEGAERATRRLATLRIDPDAARRLDAAAAEVAKARARLEIAGPKVTIHPEQAITVLGQGGHETLVPSISRAFTVVDRLEIVAPGVVRVEITPGTSTSALREDLAARERELAKLLEDAGALDLEDASRKLNERKDAERIVVERDRILREQLGELTLDTMERRLSELLAAEEADPLRSPGLGVVDPAGHAARSASGGTGEGRTPPGDATRSGSRTSPSASESAPSAGELAAALAEARAAVEAAASRLAAARVEAERKSSAAKAARDQDQAVRVRFAQRQAEVLAARREAEAAAASLAATRAERSDQDLDAEFQALDEECAERRLKFEAARTLLAAAAPESLRERAGNARRAAEDAQEARVRSGQERAAIEGRLAARGESGLHERLERGRAELAAAERAESSLRDRAVAARVLYESFSRARDRARKSYAAPLREKIESLARIVFGPGVTVTLDDDLAITSRTLDGRTVPYESLSAGTREQLGILARLAAASIVARDGTGVPVVFDDVLGFADPGRREAMAAALRVAGRSCQLIVLTCDPERYRDLGDAHLVRLVPGAPQA